MKKKYLIGTCGHYDSISTHVNGQTVKTVTVTNELRKIFGETSVQSISTHLFRKNPVKFMTSLINIGLRSKQVVLFPDANAIKVVIPLMVFFKQILGLKTFYVVIGGWLPETLKVKRWLRYCVARLDGIFVETKTLQVALSEIGLQKVYVMPNFKRLEILTEKEVAVCHEKPLRLCFFSRVVDEKGITELVETVQNFNRHRGNPVFLLDIYGPVDPKYTHEFQQTLKNSPPYIRYCGVIESDKTVDVLKDYFLQVFPTKYRTEGIPGSIIDSYCAGTPVLAARWNSWADIIDEGMTGMTFELGDFSDLFLKLGEIEANPCIIDNMRRTCIEKANRLKPDSVINVLVERIAL